MSSELVNWISIIGSVLSLISLWIAIEQIRKTKHAAEAALEASNHTQQIISRNLLLSDVKTCLRNLEEIQSFVQHKKYEPAQIRIKDLISNLIQIQQRAESSEQAVKIEFEKMLLELTIIREDFEKKVIKTSARINSIQINSQLSIISDELNKLTGSIIIAIEKGEQNEWRKNSNTR